MILVSPDAARTLERRFALAPVALAQAPGGPAYRLEGLEQPGLAPRGAMTTFVGRESEMEHVHHVLARAAAGHGQVVAIVGEPGVGKSRFVWEVAQALVAKAGSSCRVSALSYGQATPYQPLIELIKGYFHIEDRDDPQQIREKVRGRLLALDPALSPSADALLALLDVPNEDSPWQALEPPQRRQRILDAIKGLCLRESAGPAPAPGARGSPLDRRRDSGAPRHPRREPPDGPAVPSGRLSPRVSAHLGQQDLLHASSASTRYRPSARASSSGGSSARTAGSSRLTALLIERTEGNPFFLEETVQTLVDSQVLGGERGAHHLARPVDAIQVPATVEAVLAARIDQLPAEASVFSRRPRSSGRTCPSPFSGPSRESPEDALRQGLATLQAAEFLYETQALPRRRVHLQARPHPRGGLRQSAPGAAAHAPRPDRRDHRAALRRTGWPSRSSGWPTTPFGARCGRRP